MYTERLVHIFRRYILANRGRQLSQTPIAKEFVEVAAERKTFVKDGPFRKVRLIDFSSDRGAESTGVPQDSGPITLAEFAQKGALLVGLAASRADDAGVL